MIIRDVDDTVFIVLEKKKLTKKFGILSINVRYIFILLFYLFSILIIIMKILNSFSDQKRKTGVIVEFSNLAFHIRSPCNLSDDELDQILDFLHEKVNTAEKKEIMNLRSLHSVFLK